MATATQVRTERDSMGKFEVPADAVSHLGRTLLLKGAMRGPGKPASLVSVYFDTDKLKLRDNGLSLRVRRVPGCTTRRSTRT